MKKISRYRRKRNSLLIAGSLSLFLFLCVGYAAFSTNLTLNAKGNIKYKKAADMLKENVVNNGDGLYKDNYEDERYIYKGVNPNNYITFNNETWRILSVEKNGSIKIIRNELLAKMKFDTHGNRTTGYCSDKWVLSHGCNAWSANKNLVGSPSQYINGSYNGEVDKDSEILTFLNNEYFWEINENASKIVIGRFNVGGIDYENNDLSNQIDQEKEYQWEGKIGLLTVSEFLRCNVDNERCGTFKLNNTNFSVCKSTNWVFSDSDWWWSLSPDHSWTSNVFDFGYDGGIDSASAGVDGAISSTSGSVRPVLYLTADIVLLGDGSQDKPFLIKE